MKAHPLLAVFWLSPVVVRSDEQCTACGLYMSESTIPGAGLGIFTGKDLQRGELIGEGDVLIPQIDIWYHLKAAKDHLEKGLEVWKMNPATDYGWRGTHAGMVRKILRGLSYVLCNRQRRTLACFLLDSSTVL
jgi:hypothetical protein